MDSFKQIQKLWYTRLEEAGFEDIEKPNGELRVEIHPHYKELAFKEREIRENYTQLAQDMLWNFDFKTESHRTIWELHVDGIPIRSIGQTLGLTRNQVWPVIKKTRTKLKVKHMSQFNIRAYKECDKDFILASWLHSYKHSSDFAKRIKHNVFYHWHNLIANNLLSRGQVSIACLPDEEDAILGYIVSELQQDQRIVHYLLVKEEWRKLGIARALFNSVDEGKPIYFTHWTAPMTSLFDKHSLIYDPYRI